MVLAALGDGACLIVETIFENRFRHIRELRKMGANIRVEGCVAVIDGVKQLRGAVVEASDLRAGAALVVAGLAAEGRSVVRDIRHIDRGCEHFESDLRALGARIRREEDDDEAAAEKEI